MNNENNSGTRPAIEEITTGDELKRWYWRKDELVIHARSIGLKATSGKFVILERIAHYLDTGEKNYPGDTSVHAKSNFDWHKEALSRETVITDSYKNTQNVRQFFKSVIGEQFKFNIAFMEWMKSNTGRTLDDACSAYHEIRNRENEPDYQTEIKEHNQFNQYTRDFLKDNPHLGMDDVRKVWSMKIKRPSETGRHIYEPGDLKLGSSE